eukprot:PITA_26152
MDVKTIFLHGDLEEEIYMKQPEGFAVKGKKELDSKPVKVPIPVGVRLSTEQFVSPPKKRAGDTRRGRGHVPCSILQVQSGRLMYAMVCTRPNIAHAVGVLSRFMSKPGKEHWTTVKRVFRLGSRYQRRSTSGYFFNLFGGAVSWMSKKQSVVALSTTEAEYMAATHASK